MTPEEWEQWREHPLTQKVREVIRGQSTEMSELLTDGYVFNASQDNFNLTRNFSRAVGYIEALDWVLELGKAERGDDN